MINLWGGHVCLQLIYDLCIIYGLKRIEIEFHYVYRDADDDFRVLSLIQ